MIFRQGIDSIKRNSKMTSLRGNFMNLKNHISPHQCKKVLTLLDETLFLSKKTHTGLNKSNKQNKNNKSINIKEKTIQEITEFLELQFSTMELKERIALLANTLHDRYATQKKYISTYISTIKNMVKKNGFAQVRNVNVVQKNEGFIAKSDHSSQTNEAVAVDALNPWMAWPLGMSLVYVFNANKENEEIKKEVLDALGELSGVFSSEFSMRECLKSDFDFTHSYILTNFLPSENYHLRRLACECTRAMLPWGHKIEQIAKNVAINASILQALASDESDYVRLSVANHLCDISKINPSYVFEIIEDIESKYPKNKPLELTKLKSHALRHLIKKQNKKALQFVGAHELAKTPKARVSLLKQEHRIYLLRLDIEHFKAPQSLIIDARLIYPSKSKKPKELTIKLFKLTNLVVSKDGITLTKKLKFIDNSVKTYLSGHYHIEIFINSKSCATTHTEVD